jgi:flagellar biosynthesis protein FliP
MSCKADLYWARPFKLIFFVPVDGWSLVAGSLVRS